MIMIEQLNVSINPLTCHVVNQSTFPQKKNVVNQPIDMSCSKSTH